MATSRAFMPLALRVQLVLLLFACVAAPCAHAFTVHSPQIVAESVTARGIAPLVGAATYGYETAHGRLVVVKARDACDSVMAPRAADRNASTGLLVPTRPDRSLEGSIVLLQYEELSDTLTNVNANLAQTCSVGHAALWAQVRGARGLLVPTTLDELGFISNSLSTEVPRTWAKLFGGAVTIMVETIARADAAVLVRAVQEFALTVDVSIGYSLLDPFSYV